MDYHQSSIEGDEEDDHHSLETSGLDDIESWISLINEDDVDEFTYDLDAFFSDDILDSDLDINFEIPIHEGGREKGVIAANPIPESAEQDYAFYGDRYQSLHLNHNERGQYNMFSPRYSQQNWYGPSNLMGPSNPVMSESPAPGGPEKEIKAVNPIPETTERVCAFYGAGQCFYGDRCRFLHLNHNEKGQYNMFASRYSQQYWYGPSNLMGPSNPVMSESPGPLVIKANKRKLQEEPNFEKKKVHLSLNGNEISSSDEHFKKPNPVYDELSDVYENREKFRSGDCESLETRDDVPGINHLIEALEYYKAENDKEKQSDEEVPSPKNHPLLLSHCESFAERNIINILKSIPILKLSEVLKNLPFEYSYDLLVFISYLVKKGSEVDILETCATILIKHHLESLLSSKKYHHVFIELKDLLFKEKFEIKVPLVNTDSSSSETSLIKGTPLRYRGWKWIDSKEQSNKSSKTDEDDVNTYFPVLSSSSTLGDETHVTEHHADAKKQTIACSFCSYKKHPEDGMDFIRAECGHVYCRPCSNWLFSKRNPVKPHICCKCQVIIKKFGNRPVFDE